MCGIAGSIDLAGKRPPDRAMLHRMADALVHRGPEDSGFFSAPGVGFAHRRLSIVGLEDGRQPIFNEDRTLAVICNGEFFDYPERRAELESKGHVFSTHSDSEVLVHLYEEYGEGLFPYLKGQFAFAIVDLVQGCVLLGRDRVGICPLFWSRQGDTIYFASEIKALFASGAVRPEADPRGLDHLFTFFALSSRRTVFKGVQSLEPGHYLKVELPNGRAAGSVVERKYWDFDFPDWGDEVDGDLPHLVDSFQSVFERAVDIRLRADVPVVGYLSGGVDSAFVMATATRVAGRALPSFTLRIPKEDLDEVDEAMEAAHAIGLNPSVVQAGSDLITDSYPALTRAAESPVLDTSCAALLALSREVRSQGYKVVLTGEGADEGFAGYVWFKMREMARILDCGDAFAVTPAVSRAIRRFGTKQPSEELRKIDALVGGPHAQSVMYSLVATSRDRYFSAGFKEELGGHVAYEDIDLDLEKMSRWHPLNRSLYFGYKIHLPGLLLSQKGDRIAMANSVETRYPFLDEDVVSFVSQLSPRWKLRRRMRDKYLLRQAAERVLPRSVAQRPKHMFQAPLADSFLVNAPEYVRELMSEESLKRTGYFDVDQVRRDSARVAADGSSRGIGRFYSLGLGGVVATQLWHHIHLGGGLCSLPANTPAVETDVAPMDEAATA